MKLLILADTPTESTGFGCVARNLATLWRPCCDQIDWWAIGYNGRPHSFPFNLYPAAFGNSNWHNQPEMQNFLSRLKHGKYTHLWMLQDTFHLSQGDWPVALSNILRENKTHSYLYYPVDAQIDRSWTNIVSVVDVAVAYTEYGRLETFVANPALEGTNIRVLPHGVDTEIFRPLPDRPRARAQGVEIRHHGVGFPFVQPDDLLFVSVSANQRRKDVSRCLQLVAELRRRDVPAKIILHMPKQSCDGVDLGMVGEQLGLVEGKHWTHADSLFHNHHSTADEQFLNSLYNTADVLLTTTLGEGWCLPIWDAVAAGCPVAIPMHTACYEIGMNVHQQGAEHQVTFLPVEKYGRVLPYDNSRIRYAVDVDKAADILAIRWKELWQKPATMPRPALSPAIREWLSWDRIAAEWFNLFKNPMYECKRQTKPITENHLSVVPDGAALPELSQEMRTAPGSAGGEHQGSRELVGEPACR